MLGSGGWEAFVTISFGDPPGTSGTVTSTFHGSTSFAIPTSNTEQGFFADAEIPLTVQSVTFTVVGEWSDEFPINE